MTESIRSDSFQPEPVPSERVPPEPVDESFTWRELVAVGVIAGDLSATAVARAGGVHPSLAEAALGAAADAGVVSDGHVDPAVAASMVADLDPGVRAQVHARISRHLMTQGPTLLIQALEHAQAAGSLVPVEEQVRAADRAGRMALSVNDYDAARRLLEFADNLDLAAPPLLRAERLRDLASALHGLGLVTPAREALARAFDLAEFAQDASLAADLAVRYSYPVDWYAGDLRAAALLERAEGMELAPFDRVALLAARAAAECRLPVPTETSQQLAWITRTSVVQPVSERALALSEDAPEPVRLLALLAWRTTHRAPEFLDARLAASGEALDIAQRLRMSDRQVDAALMLAVDHLEAGDRSGFDQALSVAMWVAERDANPRLGWHAHTVAASAAIVDLDLERAERHRLTAARLGESIDAPGWMGADLSLQFQLTLEGQPPERLADWLVEESHPITANPIGRINLARVHLVLDRPETAERLVRRAMAQFDTESSLLQNAVLAARAAAELDAEDVVESLIARLEPWQQRFAVDSNAWWASGPVSLALAILHHSRGDSTGMIHHLRAAEVMSRTMGDLRSLREIDRLGQAVPALAASGGSNSLLSDRETKVLQLVASGATNAAIAEEMSFSLSTIRSEISTIYRKLGVRSRPEAVARAVGLGLV